MYKVMFATPPLMLMTYGGGDFSKLVEHVKQIPYGDPSNGSQSNLPSKNNYILEEDEFANLRNFISGCVEQYTKDILLSNQKLKLTQSWINKTDTGAIHTMHYHPNSVLSGVFYFNSHSSPIEFVSDRKDQFSLVKNRSEFNEFTSSSYSVPAQAGLLILFPSYIFHRVSVNEEQETRYSMSFNTFPDGEMGAKESMSYVKL